MEIKNYKELNALNKLLGKVKFQNDLDFHEFKEFASSPIISEIFTRLQKEYLNESVKLGYLKEDQKLKFEFDSEVGKTLKMRIDELNKQEREILLKNNNVEVYVKTLISPLALEKSELDKLIHYAQHKFN